MKSDLITFLRKFISWSTLFPPRATNKKNSIFLTAAWLFIVYTVISGSFRKWVFGRGAVGNIIFLVQLLMPLIFYWLLQQRKLKFKIATPPLFLVLVAYLFLVTLNPMNKTVFHGIFGLVIHLGFWLCLLGWFQTRPFFEIEKLTNLIIVILLGECLLGSIQSVLPASHFLNILSTGEESSAFVGSSVRVAGTFSYLAGLASFVVFMGFFIWYLTVIEYPPTIVLIVFILSLFTGLLTGGRGAVFILVIVSFTSFLVTGFF